MQFDRGIIGAFTLQFTQFSRSQQLKYFLICGENHSGGGLVILAWDG